MAENQKPRNFQERMEINIWVLLPVLAVVLSVAGIVEIVPLFTMKDTFEHQRVDEAGNPLFPELVWDQAGATPIVTVDENGTEQWSWKAGNGVRPFTAVELAGRDIYQREGCYTCHSQMIRPFRDEKERYGHYSLASESMFNHPFQWGSKRTGPDLARVGGKYSDEWHRAHLYNPRDVVPESVMPSYPWLQDATVDATSIKAHMTGLRTIGVPYAQEDIDSADKLLAGKTEMEVVVEYLQVLGTMAHLDDSKSYRE